MTPDRFFVALLLMACFAGAPLGAAAPGEAEVQAAVALTMENQARAFNLGRDHMVACLAAGGKGGADKQGAAAAEKSFYAAADPDLRRAYGQLAVIRRLLAVGEAAADPKVLAAAITARKVFQAHQATLDLAVGSLAPAFNAPAVRKELSASMARFDEARDPLPGWASVSFFSPARIEEFSRQYAAEIDRAAAGAKYSTVPAARLAAEQQEVLDKKRALEVKKEADAAYREVRMKELEAGRQAREREEQARVAARPAEPPRLPADAPMIAAWHKTYSFKIRPFKQALGKLLATDRSRQSKDLAQACGELSTAAQAAIRDRAIFTRSDAINRELTTFLLDYKQAAGSCFAGELPALEAGLKKGEAGIGRLAAVLQPYQLAP